MAEIYLTQSDADALIEMPKLRVDDQVWSYPDLGGNVSVPLVSENKRENFLLDVSRGRIDLLRNKYQNRARQTVVLVRLDLGGPPHRNPDGEEILCPHIHRYREGYGDKWATPVPPIFSNLGDILQVLYEFMRFCNIVKAPRFQKGLFT